MPPTPPEPPPAPPLLRELEERLFALIRAPEGVAAGLRQMDMTAGDLGTLVRGDARLDAVARLDIYANMYFFRLLDILRADYSALAAVLGEGDFHNLVTDYLAACPSSAPSVREVGARLPAFLRTHASAAERPWLAALAALERARLELFDAADAPCLTLEALRAVDPDGFAGLPLALVPAHALVDADHAVADVWRAAEDEAPLPEPAAGAQTILVWREERTVYHRVLAPLEAELVRQLARATAPTPFGVICDRVAEAVPVEEAGRLAFELLARWTGDQLLRAL